MFVSRPHPTRTPTTEGSPTAGSPGVTALRQTLLARKQRLLPLVFHDIDPIHCQCYTSTHQKVRTLNMATDQTTRHLCIFVVSLSTKRDSTSVIWRQSASYQHRSLSRNWLSFVLKNALTDLRKLPATATEANTIAPIVSVVTKAGRYLHKTRIPRSHRNKTSLLITRKIENMGWRTSASKQLSRPETIEQAPPALLPVPLESEPSRNGKLTNRLRGLRSIKFHSWP